MSHHIKSPETTTNILLQTHIENIQSDFLRIHLSSTFAESSVGGKHPKIHKKHVQTPVRNVSVPSNLKNRTSNMKLF